MNQTLASWLGFNAFSECRPTPLGGGLVANQLTDNVARPPTECNTRSRFFLRLFRHRQRGIVDPAKNLFFAGDLHYGRRGNSQRGSPVRSCNICAGLCAMFFSDGFRFPPFRLGPVVGPGVESKCGFVGGCAFLTPPGSLFYPEFFSRACRRSTFASRAPLLHGLPPPSKVGCIPSGGL
jgi:hypothetical protein